MFLINGPEKSQVSVPREKGDESKPERKTTQCGLFRHNENTLAVKVFEREGEFKREKLSLTSMANLLSGDSELDRNLEAITSSLDSDFAFYAHATSSGTDALEWFSTAKEKKESRSLPTEMMITNMIKANNKYCKEKGFEMWWADGKEGYSPYSLNGSR